MTEAISETPAAGIGKLLMESRFVVPNHQRDYSWEEDKVKQLFDDIEDALAKPASAYFLGLVVFLNSEGRKLTVLDGQQRLATVVIIFSAIRSWLQQYGTFQDDASRIQDRFIGTVELGEKTPQPRMTMNEANDQTFNDYVVKSVPLKDVKAALQRLKRYDRNRKLLAAVVYAHERIAEIAAKFAKPEEAAKYFFRLVTYIRDSVSVVRLTVATEDAAFTIFETLNDRGVDLSPLDLVKNYLFSKAKEESSARLRDIEARWTQMMFTLGNVRPDQFLKTFWTSRHGRIRTPSLFNSFKREYPGPKNAISVSTDMLDASEQYAALGSADDPVWAQYSPNVRRTVRSLTIIGSQQAHPVMLSALTKMNPGEVERTLRLLEVVIVRYLLVGGGNTGRFETTCAILARRIYAIEIKTATAALAELKDVYPSDDEFRRNFETKQEENHQKGQYFLRALEMEVQRVAAGEMPGELVPGTLTVEHILPKNPGKEWEDVLKADSTLADECTFRLGNQCLLTDVNKKLGRLPFSEKKKTYQKSKLITTKEVANYSLWGRKEIEQRQINMARIAVSVWRFQ